MAQFTFYTVAMSRGQIARWALHVDAALIAAASGS